MQTRNLIIRLNSDELRLGRQWLADAIHGPADRAGQVILDALNVVQDAGDLTGTPFELEERSAPMTAGDTEANTPPESPAGGDTPAAPKKGQPVPPDAAVPQKVKP